MNRTVLALACSLVVGTVMMRRYPFPSGDDVMLVLADSKPWLVQGLDAIWRAMMFSTPFIFLQHGVFPCVYLRRQIEARCHGAAAVSEAAGC